MYVNISVVAENYDPTYDYKQRYLTSSVYDTAYRTVSVTFSSTGGNIYGSVNL